MSFRNKNNRSRRARNPRGGRRARGQLQRQMNNFRQFGRTNYNVSRSFNNNLPSHSINSNSWGFPDTYDVTLVYSNDLNLASSVGEQQMIYEGNNPWDPDPQLGGKSADQYQIFAQAYRYCRVYGSAIEVNYNIINQEGFQVCVTPRAENASSSYEILMTMPKAKTGRFVSLNGMTSWTIRNSCNTATLYGIKNLDYDIANTFSLINGEQSSTVTEPLRKWYWHVAAQCNATQNLLNAALKVRIFYKCHFYGRIYGSVLSSPTNDGDEEIPILVSTPETIIEDPPEPISFSKVQDNIKLYNNNNSVISNTQRGILRKETRVS